MYKYSSPSVKEVKIEDRFFAPRIETNHKVTIPTSLKRCHETGRIDAFKLNWKEGMPNRPHIFWDSDVAKVLEGMANALAIHKDAELEQEADELIDLIVSSQQSDGYLNSYFSQIDTEKRWTDLSWAHELYCAGHLIEAAVAYYEATGKRKMLDSMCRYADYIESVFGREDGKKHGYPGHPELELALVRLYHATGNRKYLNLSKYFIDERGQEPNYFVQENKDNANVLVNRQAHEPLRNQTEAVGHAVRAVYLYSGMTDIAAETGDESLRDACIRLWESITERKMYITGGIGSKWQGELLGDDYFLPNDTAYAESCASIGLVYFASRMLNLEGGVKYADIIEKALFNGAISGLSLDGDKFFYSNRLDIDVSGNEVKLPDHLSKVRLPWFVCSCCPTNYCRFIPSIGQWLYSYAEDSISINIPVQSSLDVKTGKLRVESNYPWDGKIKIAVERGGDFSLRLRVPGWCCKAAFAVNGKKIKPEIENGFAVIRRKWNSGDTVEYELDMPVMVMRARSEVSNNIGKIALQRGPIVYCLESTDNPVPLSSIIVPVDQEFETFEFKGLLPGTVAIRGMGFTEKCEFGDGLYSTAKVSEKKINFMAIPYCLWQNRGPASMSVWIRGR